MQMQLRRTAAIGLILAAAPLAAADLTWHKIVLDGDAVPGAPGTVFHGVNSVAAINNLNHVAFKGAYTSGLPSIDIGLFMADALGQPTSMVIHSDVTPAPGQPPNVFLSSPSDINLNDQDNLAFRSLLVTTASGQIGQAIISGPAGSLSTTARTGVTGPGASLVWSNLVFGPVQNNSGTVAFAAGGSGTSPTSVWSGSSSTPALLCEVGLHAPGFPSNTQFRQTIGTPVISDDGSIAFPAQIQGTSTLNALWQQRPSDPLHAVAQSGQATPLGSTFSTFSRVSTNNTGKLAFASNINGSANLNSVFTYDPATAQMTGIISPNAPLPDAPGGQLTTRIHHTSINNAGTVIVEATVDASNGVTFDNDDAIWRYDGGSLTKIVQEGAPIPGLPAGDSMKWIGTGKTSQLNERGQFVMLWGVQGPDVANGDTALFAYDPVTGPFTLVREGDFFQVAPGDSRQISRIDFAGISNALTGATGGTARGLNDQGYAVVSLTFSAPSGPDTSGIFLVQIPTPATALTLTFGLLITGRRRHA